MRLGLKCPSKAPFCSRALRHVVRRRDITLSLWSLELLDSISKTGNSDVPLVAMHALYLDNLAKDEGFISVAKPTCQHNGFRDFESESSTRALSTYSDPTAFRFRWERL